LHKILSLQHISDLGSVSNIQITAIEVYQELKILLA